MSENATSRPRVLVICTANRCRSQMAEGWLRHHGGNAIEALSAGVRETFVHPLAIKVMAERGVDLSGQRSKHVDEFAGQSPFDLVVTVCDSAREACPVPPPATRTVHHPFSDPDAATGTEDEVLAVFRRVRDEIDVWARDVVAELMP